jgi:hypothetical protein
MKRAILTVFSAIAIAGLSGHPALATDLVGVSMPCSDPNGSLAVNVDSTTVGSLALATQGMVDFPSGLNCSLTQTSPSTGNPVHNFAVGGGQFLEQCNPSEPSFALNFSFSAHSDADGSNVQGTVNLTNPSDQSCLLKGHETGNVLCLVVVGNTAAFAGEITNADGGYSNNKFFEGHATDNGDPQNGQPVDTVAIFGSFTPTSCPLIPGQFPVSNGNIVVHQAS